MRNWEWKFKTQASFLPILKSAMCRGQVYLKSATADCTMQTMCNRKENWSALPSPKKQSTTIQRSIRVFFDLTRAPATGTTVNTDDIIDTNFAYILFPYLIPIFEVC